MAHHGPSNQTQCISSACQSSCVLTSEILLTYNRTSDSNTITTFKQHPMSPAPSILLIGLPWNHPSAYTMPPDPNVIRAGLESAVKTINDAGYTPDDEARKQGLIAQLKANDYNGVIIGYGVRAGRLYSLRTL